MKLLLTHIRRLMMLALLVSTVISCRDKELLDSPFVESDIVGNVSLHIAIGMPDHASRASVPQGGEYGDGLEMGQHHENDINTLSLFAYQGSINGPASTPVKLVAYLTDLNLTTQDAEVIDGMLVHTIRIDDKFINGYSFSPADRFIVVTNMQTVNAATLGELRNGYVSAPVTKVAAGEPLAGCTDFVMSNEKESSYVDGVGSPTDPHLITVTIERVTARVDLITSNADIDETSQTLRYDAIDGKENTKVADVYLSHARVFNAMSAPSYLIKRVAENETSKGLYLADENKPANKIVVEPHTWMKGTNDNSLLSSWYGESHISNAQALGNEWFRDADCVHTALPSSGNDGFVFSTSVDDAGNRYYVLDYVNENTMSQVNTLSKVTTGIMLSTVYKPVTVLKRVENGTKVVDDEYAYGQTFWRYRPITAEYDETKSLYFSSLSAAQAYMHATPDVTAEITEYTNAQCYYPVFLRHDNTLNTPYINMMEYGIVRNNIYRLKVSFTGPGYPTMDEIEEVNPEGIRPYIFVRKWYKIQHPEIEI